QGGERSRSSSSDGEDGARGEEEKRHDGRWHVEENPRGPRAIARELAYRPRDEHAPGRREKTDPSDGAPSGAEDDASEPSRREAEGTIAPRALLERSGVGAKGGQVRGTSAGRVGLENGRRRSSAFESREGRASSPRWPRGRTVARNVPSAQGKERDENR